MGNPDKKILLDADVISHFIKGDQLNSLPHIEYIKTDDILYEGFKKGILSESVCDEFIQTIKRKGSKFPYNTFNEILER